MKLPNGHRATIDLRKLTEYTLNPEHGDGRHKAALFQELLGIGMENVAVLEGAIRRAAAEDDAQPGREDRYGQRYVVDFDFSGPGGMLRVRSAWIIRPRETIPRLVTCYIL